MSYFADAFVDSKPSGSSEPAIAAWLVPDPVDRPDLFINVRLTNGASYYSAIGSVSGGGIVTADQGAPNLLSSAWPVKITDGTSTLGTVVAPINVTFTSGGLSLGDPSRPISVTGPLTDAQMRASAVPVEASLRPVSIEASAKQDTVGTTPMRLDSPPLADRRQVLISNDGDRKVYVGFAASVTEGTGFPLSAGRSLALRVSDAIELWAVAQDTGVLTNLQHINGLVASGTMAGFGSVLSSNDTYAIGNAMGQTATVTDFVFVPTLDEIQNISIAMESHRDAAGGVVNPVVTLSYELSGIPGATSAAFEIISTVDTDLFLDITSDRVWVTADIANLKVIATVASIGVPNVLIDHLHVHILENETNTTSRIALLEMA